MKHDTLRDDPVLPTAIETPDGFYVATRRNVTMPGPDGSRFRQVVVGYGLRKIGDQAPYFTVTGSAWCTRPDRMPASPDVSGQIHDILHRVFPELVDLIDLHLSDVNGVPMHAVANGWYWYSDGHEPYPAQWDHLTGSQRAADYLRAPADHFPAGLDKAGFVELTNALRLGWSREATTAIVRHNLTT